MYVRNNATRDFNKIVKGKNIMTPHIHLHKYVGDYVVEIAKGTGLSGEEIIGVTVISMGEQEHKHDLSKMFYSLKEAHEYINTLEND